MNKRLVVIIPVYQNRLNDSETISVRICQKKMSKYDIYFIAPFGLNMEAYREFASIKVKRFPDHYFKGVDTYNKLMMNPKFYVEFSEYEYMLIAQTDTLILQDGAEIEKFMDAGYDYWGAPWEECQHYWFYTTKRFLYEKFKLGKKFLLRVGNGGFSLRHIKKTIHLLNEKKVWKILWRGNEDFFFSCYGLDNKSGYRVAPLNLARKFALETDIKKNLENGEQPYAVHKWQEEYPKFEDISSYITG